MASPSKKGRMRTTSSGISQVENFDRQKGRVAHTARRGMNEDEAVVVIRFPVSNISALGKREERKYRLEREDDSFSSSHETSFEKSCNIDNGNKQSCFALFRI